jgi:hypothetical protein
MIYCGIASIKGRDRALKIVVERILPQVDYLFVALNNYTSIPPWLAHRRIHVDVLDNSLGDAAKHLHADEYNGYGLSLDDDLLVKRDYVINLIKGIDKYGCVVGYHGRKYPRPVVDFKEWIGNYGCLRTVAWDIDVDILGDGCCGYQTSRLKLSISDFKSANKGDLWLSKTAHDQNVPMVVLQHRKGDILYLKPQTPTIWRSTLDYTEHTEILKSYLK